MIVKVDGLSFSYRSASVLEDISLTVGEHEIVAVLGPNGAGKSTLLKCIDGILAFRKGAVLIDGEDIRRLSRTAVARKIGYVSQRNETSRLTAFDAILLGRYPHARRGSMQRDAAVVQSIIQKLHLEPLTLRTIDEMSGGELQKVCIARALAQEPRLLLLDEPTASLDLKNQVEILRLIRTIVDGHDVSAIMSLHDINTAVHYADRIVFLKNRRIHALCSKAEIDEQLIEEVYGIRVKLHRTADYPIVVPAQYSDSEET